MPGYLATQTAGERIEVTYIAYFGRAADGGGLVYWGNQFTTQTAAGASQDAVLTAIANSFAVQAEATALYPAGQPVGAFLGAVYQNLFGHAPDAAGQAYWAGQIGSGAVSMGAAVLAIADGAAAADAATLGFKVQAAGYFTTETLANNIGTSGMLNPGFLVNAAAAVSSVVDGLSEAASEAASLAWIGPHGGTPPPAPAVVGIPATTADAAGLHFGA